jgi:hypothetical protein
MAEMQRKITSLTHNQTATMPSQPTTTQMNGFPVQQQQQQILRVRQQQHNVDQAVAPPAALAANATTTAAALGSSLTGLSLQQQQAQQLLQRLQVRFQAQQQQLIRAQQQETAQLRTQQLQRQHQLAQQQQQQGVSPEQRRKQLQQLQQQHEIARARLQQMHKAKQQQLQSKQQHFLVQKQQQLQLQTGQQPQTPAASSAQQPLDMVATQPQTVLQPQQPQVHMAQPAQAQQAAVAVPMATDVAAPVSATGGMDASYSERLRELKTKYWDDLVIVYKEFERMVKQKPAGQQLERVNTFLMTLRRVIAVLQQDPSKPVRNNKNDLDRVEAHIQKQVLPMLQRLKDRARIAGTGADVEMSDSLRVGGDGVGDGDVAGVGADTVPNTTTTETETRSLSVQQVMEMCCCPISLEVMRDPVMTPSGVSYERAMIEQHLEMVGEFDPMTHEKLTKAQLYPNRMLKQLVEMTLASFGPAALEEILL